MAGSVDEGGVLGTGKIYCLELTNRQKFSAFQRAASRSLLIHIIILKLNFVISEKQTSHQIANFSSPIYATRLMKRLLGGGGRGKATEKLIAPGCVSFENGKHAAIARFF